MEEVKDKDKAMFWKDETGEYKLGYSQKLQEDIAKELEKGNNEKKRLRIVGYIVIFFLSLLTILGIVIGITSVVIVFSAGEGFTTLINDQIDGWGADTIEIEAELVSKDEE